MARVADHMTPAGNAAARTAPAGALAGRVWLPDVGGPAVVAVRADGVYDISQLAPTMRDLCEAADPAAIVRDGKGERIGALEDILANTPEATRDARKPWLLAPIDLQAIKAAGVTFPAVHAGARDRGAGARRAGEGRGDPQERAGPARRRHRASSCPAARRPPSSSAC